MYRIRGLNYILCKYGHKQNGVELGPSVLMNEFKKKNTPIYNENIHEIYSKQFKKYDIYNQISKCTNAALKYGGTNIYIGGDHYISACTVPHYFDKYKDNMQFVWIDTRGNININDRFKNDNNICNIYNIFNTKYNKYKPSYDQLTYIGIRDLETVEKKIKLENDITFYTLQMIRRNTFSNRLNINNKFVYISFCIDSTCSTTGKNIDNGLYPFEVADIIDSIDKQNTIIGFDFVGYNPLVYDENGNTLSTHVDLLTFVSHMVYEKKPKTLIPF